MTCGRYDHQGETFWHREGEDLPKCHYCNKPGHVKKDCQKRIKEEKWNEKRTKITRRKRVITKLTVTKKSIYTRRKRQKITCKQLHRRRNLWCTIYCKNIKPRAWQRKMYPGLWCHVTYGKIRRKHGKPQGRQTQLSTEDSVNITGTKGSDWHIYQDMSENSIAWLYQIRH